MNIWPKKDENEEWRRLHNEVLHSLYCSPNIVRVIKSRRLRWAGHIARMEEGRFAIKISINMRIWIDLAHDMDYWRALVNVALNLRIP